MIVIIHDGIFLTASPLALLAIFRLCFDERHIALTDPVFIAGATPSIDTWLATLPRELRNEAMLVLEQGPIAASQKTSKSLRVRVEAIAQSRFSGPVPLLTLDDALHVLHMPLQLIVENGRNDGAFLKRIAPPLWRQPFIQALERRWIEFENAGGIGELTMRIRLASTNAREWMRLWVMFDSDARAPGQASQQSQLALRACASNSEPWTLPAHQLSRRAIENYLPIKALFMWAEGHSGVHKTRLRRAAGAFQALDPDRRAHYNMKDGLLGDVPQPRRSWYVDHDSRIVEEVDVHILYHGLTEEVRGALHVGFGSDVARLFGDDTVTEDWLRVEIPFQLREEIFQSIFDWI
jgi:hypothetical protein